MAFNPTKMIRLIGELKQFDTRHPKMARFIDQQLMGDLPEGTIVEVTVTKPGQEPVAGNFKATMEDNQLFKDLKEVL